MASITPPALASPPKTPVSFKVLKDCTREFQHLVLLPILPSFLGTQKMPTTRS